MSIFSILVIEEDSIQTVRRTFEGRELDFWHGSFGRAVTLESLDVFKKANLPPKRIQIRTETTVLDVIKQCKGNLAFFDPFPRTSEKEYIVEYGYILKRPQISKKSVVDSNKYSKETLRSYYQTKVASLGFLNNEVVILGTIEISRKHSGHFLLYSVHFPPTVVDFLSMVRECPSSEARLHMALLYTDADKEFSCFLRETYSDIHVLSGSRFKVYAIERANTYENVQESLQYWKSLLSEKLYVIWSSLGWLSTKPYDKAQSYEIGKHLGITPDQFPCLALFDIPHPDRVLISSVKTIHQLL